MGRRVEDVIVVVVVVLSLLAVGVVMGDCVPLSVSAGVADRSLLSARVEEVGIEGRGKVPLLRVLLFGVFRAEDDDEMIRSMCDAMLSDESARSKSGFDIRRAGFGGG